MKKLIAYICETDYNWEFDQDNADLPEFFSSVKSLKRQRTCWKECGIMKVEVTVRPMKKQTKAGD